MNISEKNKKDIPSYEFLMDTVRKLISTAWNIGNEIHQQSIDKWLDNFTGEALYIGTDEAERSKATEREKRLALFLLCNFVYYNKNEIKHLVKLMLARYIHNVFISENNKTITDDDYIEPESV